MVPETSKIGPGISQALNGAQAGAEKSGRGMGSRLASGIGTTLKVGALAAGAVAGLAVGTALTKGMGRLVAIDDAKGKLAGLGHDTQGIATIMDSALASVKGTAYGLGDAATIAASAVAAGIKPGQELTKYLSLTGDAATIAGTSLEEMGSIFNKVQTSGTVFTDNLNQLSDRGIPIFQWLQDEYKVSADELSDMVKKGEVDSETFKKVIEENIGGAALESGKTLRGSFENMKAALGRVGESALKPFAKLAQDSFGGVGGFADKLAPKVEAMSTKVATGLTGLIGAFKSSGDSIEGSGTKWERFGARLRTVTDGIQGVWSILAKGDFAGSKMTFGLDEDSKVVDILFRIREGAIAAYDGISKFFSGDTGNQVNTVLGGITSAGDSASSTLDNVGSVSDSISSVFDKLVSAASSVGTSLLSLGGDTTVVVAAGIKVMASAMGFLADNADLAGVALGGAAVAMVGAKVIQTGYQAAKIASAIMLPAQIAAQMALTKALVAHTAALWANTGAQAPNIALTLRARVAQLAAAAADRVRTAATVQSTSALGAYATAQRLAATTSTPLVAAARNGAANIATLGAQARNVGGAAMGALKTGASRVASFIGPGGAFMIGIAAAIGTVMAFKSSSDKMTAGLKATRDAAGDYSKSMVVFRENLDEAFASSGGDTDSGVKSVVSAQIEKIDKDLDDAAGRIPGKWDKFVAFARQPLIAGGGGVFSSDTAVADSREVDDAGRAAERAQGALEKLDLTQRDLTSGVTGSAASWLDMKSRLESTGSSGQILVDKYSGIRREFIESQSAASGVRDALAGITTNSIGAAGGVDGLTSALGRLRGDQMTAEETQKRLNDALRGFSEAAANGGSDAVSAAGQIDTTTAAGSRLFDAMRGVQGAFDQAGAEAARSATEQKLSSEDAANFVQAAGQRVRDEFIRQRVEAGMTLEKATALADQYRLFPLELPTTITLHGVDEALTGLGQLRKTLDSFANGPTVNAPNPAANVPINPALPMPGRATGGRLPTSGPGTETTDGFLAVASNGAPIARVDAGEWVINGRSSDRYDRELAAINAGTFPKLAGYEEGGRVGLRSPEELLGFVNGSESQPLTGSAYDWGGVKWGDCSAAMAAIARFAVGLPAFASRFATATMGSALASMGFQSGLGGLGDLNFGWLNGGPGGGHTAGTLPGGVNVEMGGSYGGGMVGGTDGASAPQFTDHAHLPIGAGAGYGASYSVGMRGGRTLKPRPEWTDKQQLDLDAAQIAIVRAEEARAEVEAAFVEGEKSQADLDMANVKVEQAQQKVTDLQAKKDDVAAYVEEGPAPQAPALSRMFSDSEVEHLDAQLAVESANERRNEVYDDPDSTPLELAKADSELFKAEEALKSAGTKKKDASSDSVSSWSDLLGNFAKDFVSGQVEDALGVFGIPNEMPSFVQAGMMLGDALAERDGTDVVDPGSASQSQIMADSPVLYDPSKGPEQWSPVAEKALQETGQSLSSAAGVLERIATKSNGDPANLLGLARDEFAAHRDPSLPNDPQNPLANLVAGLRNKPIRGYHDGGPVVGPSGRDKVPAWLEASEFVVNSRSANAGANGQILQAINGGAQFGQASRGGAEARAGATYHLYGITDAEDAIRRVKVKERQDHAAMAGTLP
ncbi:hypothetical protein BJI47_22540 [Rhodococcus sp. 1168]|nr:hypothetical protein BJI47_22540 [Rhodococcus sp. 1168]